MVPLASGHVIATFAALEELQAACLVNGQIRKYALHHAHIMVPHSERLYAIFPAR